MNCTFTTVMQGQYFKEWQKNWRHYCVFRNLSETRGLRCQFLTWEMWSYSSHSLSFFPLDKMKELFTALTDACLNDTGWRVQAEQSQSDSDECNFYQIQSCHLWKSTCENSKHMCSVDMYVKNICCVLFSHMIVFSHSRDVALVMEILVCQSHLTLGDTWIDLSHPSCYQKHLCFSYCEMSAVKISIHTQWTLH